jgi:hypothetical protein
MIDLDTLIREADPARDLVIPEVDLAEIRRLSERPPAGTGTPRDGLRTGMRAVPLPLRIRGDAVAMFVATLVVIAVGAVILTAGSQHPARAPAHHLVPRPSEPRVIRNYWPHTPPPLPGWAGTADLAKPGAIAGVAGPPNGVFTGSVVDVVNEALHGVNEAPFTITAAGLPPNTDGNVYAVWIEPALSKGCGQGLGGCRLFPGSRSVLVKPIRPQLLGVIRPGVGRDGKLAAEGEVRDTVLNNYYLLLITLQRSATPTTPGRIVIEGFIGE